MSDDNTNNGRVHSHAWAQETAPEGITRLAAPRLRVSANDTAAAMNRHPEEPYNDGLLHDHGANQAAI